MAEQAIAQCRAMLAAHVPIVTPGLGDNVDTLRRKRFIDLYPDRV